MGETVMSYYIKPTSDMFIKYLFGSEEHKELLLSFINAVLEDSDFNRIVEIKLENPFNIKTFVTDKESILDIKACDERGRWYDIEIQSSGDDYFIHRTLYYWSKLYANQLETGDKYGELKPAICINILDFILFEENPHSHNCYVLKNYKNIDEILTDHLTLHYIELPKVESDNLEEKLEHWLRFLKYEGKEDDYMKTLLEKDMDIKKAYGIYNRFTQNDEFRHAYEAREKWKKDYASGMDAARRKGLKEGELLDKQHILIKQLSRKFGLTEEETQLIRSIKNLERLEKALDDIIFADSKNMILECLK